MTNPTTNQATANPTQTRDWQLADALEAIAKVNHYMVGLTEHVTFDELNDAQQILINRQNLSAKNGRAWRRIGLALDICDRLLTEAA